MIDPLPPDAYRDLVARALAEDIGTGDVTTAATVRADQRARGIILAKSELVVSGLGIAADCFRQCDVTIGFTPQRQDGDHCLPGTIVATAEGAARALLTAERTALNFLQRLSG